MPASTRRTSPSPTTSWGASSPSRLRSIGAHEESVRMTRARVLAGIVVLFWAATASAQAPRFTPDTVDLAAARKEGGVTWYTSTPIETAQKIATLFQSQTGIRVELFRSGGSA